MTDPLLPRQNPNLLCVRLLWPERALEMERGGGCLGGGAEALGSSRFVRAADTGGGGGGGRRKKGEKPCGCTQTEGRRSREKVRRSSSFCARLPVCLACAGAMRGPCCQCVLASGGAVCEQGRVAYRCREMQMEERGRGRVPGSTESETSGRERLVCC